MRVTSDILNNKGVLNKREKATKPKHLPWLWNIFQHVNWTHHHKTAQTLRKRYK